MAATITHTTVAVGTDAGNGEIRKAQWNESHTLTGTIDIANGGTGATTAPAGIQALDGTQFVTSAAGTTTLTATSPRNIIITGTLAQTIVLPDVSTLALGWAYNIISNTTGVVTVQSSGLNSFASVQSNNMSAVYRVTSLTGTTTASWTQQFTGGSVKTGVGPIVYNFQPTIQQLQITSANGVTAGTNAQGQGALTEAINIITTAANNPSGVTLPSPTAATNCRIMVVINKGANPLAVFPASGHSIDAIAVNTAISVPVGGVMAFWSASTTQWYSSANSTISSVNGLFSSGTAGIGYVTGAGGTVSQATSRATGVTLNKITGAITLFSTTTTAGTFDTFTVTNSTVAATDAVIVNFVSATSANSYSLVVSAVAAGSFTVQIHNIAAVAVAEAPVIRFAVIKGVSA